MLSWAWVNPFQLPPFGPRAAVVLGQFSPTDPLAYLGQCRTLKAISGLDGMDGWMDGWDGYTTTAVTPRASLQSDANNPGKIRISIFYEVVWVE